ncbi:MAG: hypothetical protein VXY33_07825 [Verrucomicrobiota bacterium]|nr:hypothetical protein [Verrucomicrobiota bacterium]
MFIFSVALLATEKLTTTKVVNNDRMPFKLILRYMLFTGKDGFAQSYGYNSNNRFYARILNYFLEHYYNN